MICFLSFFDNKDRYKFLFCKFFDKIFFFIFNLTSTLTQTVNKKTADHRSDSRQLILFRKE